LALVTGAAYAAGDREDPVDERECGEHHREAEQRRAGRQERKHPERDQQHAACHDPAPVAAEQTFAAAGEPIGPTRAAWYRFVERACLGHRLSPSYSKPPAGRGFPAGGHGTRCALSFAGWTILARYRSSGPAPALPAA